MPLVITPPSETPTPSDNRIVFSLAGDVGVGQTLDPQENNFVGLMLENVSGDYTDGVWNVVDPLPEGPVKYIKLPNVGTELIIDLYNAAGVPVPDDLPDDLDRYTPNNLTLTFVSGTTATLEGEFVSVDNSDYVWTVDIEFDSPVNWATWSGGGGTYCEPVEDFPLNRIVFNDGQAATEETIESFIGETPTDFTSDGTTVTFSNDAWDVGPLDAGETVAMQSNAVEMYLRCNNVPSTRTFSGYTNLQKIHFLNVDFFSYSGTALFNDNPALTEVYWSGDGMDIANLFGTSGGGGLDAVRTVFIPNAGSIAGADTGWLGDVPKATLTIYAPTSLETNNGGGVQAELAAVTAAGGTVEYTDCFIDPNKTTSDGEIFTTLWEVNSANSSLTGKTGSPLEGITLTVDGPLGTQASMATETANAAMVLDGTNVSPAKDTVAMNFTITGATTGSIFFGLNSYSYEVGVYINDTLHSTHRLLFSPGDVVNFDVSRITRSVIGRPLITTGGVASTKAYGTVHLVVQVRAGSTLLDETYTSDKIVFWKARLDEVDFNNWDASDWTPGPGSAGKFLTNYPEGQQRLIQRGANFYLTTFYPGLPVDIDDDLRIRRRGYTSDGGSLVQTTQIGTSSVYSDGLPDIWKVAVVNLGGTSWSSLIGSAGYIDVDLYDTTNSEPWTTSVGLTVWEGDCNEGATVHFMNKLGGMETFYFPIRKLDEARIEDYKVQVDTGDFAPQDNGVYAYLLQAVDRVTLRSDWLTEAVQNWLVEELFESPFILIEIGGVQVRAFCRETQWTKRTFANDAIFDVNAEFEISERRYSPLV